MPSNNAEIEKRLWDAAADLHDVLPKTDNRLDKAVLVSLLQI
jgi:hypothetical protein